MTLADMKKLLRIYLDDRQADRWTDDTELELFLNEGQREVRKEILQVDESFFEECQSYTVVPDTDSYEFTLPTDFLKVRVAERIVAGEVPVPATWTVFSQRHQWEPTYWEVTTGRVVRPVCYLRNNRLGVVKPDSSFTLRVFYDKRLADLTQETDVSELPEEFHKLVVLQAAKEMLAAEDRVFGLQDEYNRQMLNIPLVLSSRQKQEPRYVRYIPE